MNSVRVGQSWATTLYETKPGFPAFQYFSRILLEFICELWNSVNGLQQTCWPTPPAPRQGRTPRLEVPQPLPPPPCARWWTWKPSKMRKVLNLHLFSGALARAWPVANRALLSIFAWYLGMNISRKFWFLPTWSQKEEEVEQAIQGCSNQGKKCFNEWCQIMAMLSFWLLCMYGGYALV